MRAGRVVAVVVGLVAGWANCDLRAEIRSTHSIRELTIAADLIVVAEPLDPPADLISTRYRVMEVVHGRKDLVGETISITDNQSYRRRSRRAELEELPPPEPIRKAILFLGNPSAEAPNDVPGGYDVVSSGIRAVNAKGEILIPRQSKNPGPYELEPAKDVTWDGMLARVREDLPRIAEIRALENIPDRGRRNEAIFRWIDQHRSELGPEVRRKGIGWGALQQQMFGWVLESGEPQACWKVFELAVEVGGWPHDSLGAFCTPEGRTLLLERTFDPARSDRLRQIAFRNLANSATLWGTYRKDLPNRRSLTKEEQERIVDKVVPLLAHDDPHWRGTAVLCVLRLCQPGDSNRASLVSHRATPALTERFRVERDPQVRRELVEALCSIEDDAFWERLTGNPEGIAVLLHSSGPQDETVELSARLLRTRVKIAEVPSIRLEKLSAAGMVEETRRLEPTLSISTEAASRGWDSSQGAVFLKAPRGNLPPGRWRATLEGRHGERRWSSDPIEITLPERPAAGAGKR